MKILLIGGTGNLSADCAAWLHEHGHRVSVVSRGRSAVPPHYQSFHADRKDPTAMQSALQGLRPDVVINFLGFERSDVELDYDLFRENLGQYIFISSTTVYAKPHRHLPLTEDAPVGNAFWDYAQKKLDCERWLLQRWHDTGFPVTIVRPSHTYSRIWIPNPVSSSSDTFAARLEQGKPVFIPDDGENPWTLTAAADFAAGLGGLVGNTAALGQTFHITSDEVLTWNRIYAEIVAALGVDSPKIVNIPTDFICQVAPRLTGTLRGDKSNPGVFDNAKIRRFVPEFQCRIPFRVGIRQSVAWLREHPDLRQVNLEVEGLIEQVIATWARDPLNRDRGLPRNSASNRPAPG